MSQNPYAQTRIGGDDFSGLPAPSRMSVLAVISLVCGILGCLPGISILAILLGVAAIFLIAGSKGRVRGTGLAIGGIVLGLIFTAFYVFIAMGVVTFAQEVQKNIIIPAQAGLTGLEKGDRGAIRKMLAPTAAASLTDAQIDQFASDVKAEFGSFKSLPDSFSDLWQAWMKAGQTISQSNQNQNFNNMIPWPVEFEKGQAIMLLEIPRGSQGGLVFTNIGVARPDLTKEFWLVPQGGSSTPAPGATTPAPPPAPPSATETPADKPAAPDDAKQPGSGSGSGGG